MRWLRLLGGDALGDLSGVGAVVHEEQFHVFFVSDQQLFESTSWLISSFSILLSSNLWASNSSLKSASDT